jgi:uncharacterized protein (TIGR02996 family)
VGTHSSSEARDAHAGDPLDAARAALQHNRFDEALGALLLAWRTRPSARLAELITAVSERCKVEVAGVRGRTAVATKAWLARADTATALEIPALLEALADARSQQAMERLAHVARWMPDPRVDDAILGWIEAVPYRATSTRPFWTALWPLARAITDPRQLPRLERAEAAGVAVTMATFLRGKFAQLAEQLAPVLGGPHDEPSILDELATLIGARNLSIGSRNIEALLAAVYDAPDDEAPRLVYADALLERGDPRGELITLQIQGRDPRRERELIETHGKRWLGELAPIVMAGYRFERGFLAACRIDNRHIDRVRRLVGHPVWSTVRELSGSALIALHPVMRALRVLEFRASEARDHEGLPESWRDLLLDTERPIEALTYGGIANDRTWEDALENNRSIRPGIQGRWVYVPAAEELAALCTCTALPRLRRLTVADSPDLVAAPLLGAPVLERLDELGFVFDSRNERRPLRWFEAALNAAPVPTLAFQLGPEFHPTVLRLERGARGYERLWMRVGPTARGNWSETLVGEAIGVLDVMPPTLREVKIETRRQTEPAQVARLRAAAAQMKLDVCQVS